MALKPIRKIMFDPNARNGDGDFTVQDGTPFERPAPPARAGVVGAVKFQTPQLPPRPASQRREGGRDPAFISSNSIKKNGRLKTSEIFEEPAIRALDEKQQQAFLGVPSSVFKKLKEKDSSIDGYLADQIAVTTFGKHPIDIWGDVWLDEQILNPQKNNKPPGILTQREEEVLDLRATGLNNTEISKRLGISDERVRQIKLSALKKRDQFSLMEDDEIDRKVKPQTARSVATSIFLDTGTSPTGLLGRMTSDDPIDDPMFESPQEREDREQAFGDFIIQNYFEPWEQDFNTREGRNPTEQEYLDYINSLILEDVAEEFELETGIPGWGLEIDEEGNAFTAEWAHAGFNSEKEYNDWFDGPVSDIIKETRPGKTQGSLFDDRKWEDYRESVTYTTYGGDQDLITRNSEQHQKFSEWTANRDWEQFHNSHFDWWAFPIDEASNTYGQQFAIPPETITKLRADQDFQKKLSENLTNAARAYGWDISGKKWIGDDTRDENQVPGSLAQIRLYKMARSALVLGHCSHFRSLQRMYDNLTSFGWYKGQDEGFWSKDHPCTEAGSNIIRSMGGDKPQNVTGAMAAGDVIAARKKRLASVKKKMMKSLPTLLKNNEVLPFDAGDKDNYDRLRKMGASVKSAKLATSKTPISLSEFADPIVATSNCFDASAMFGGLLIQKDIAKQGEVWLREVGAPGYADDAGTHYVVHIGPKNSKDAIIVDLTLRQFLPVADFPWIGTVQEYKESGYKTRANDLDEMNWNINNPGDEQVGWPPIGARFEEINPDGSTKMAGLYFGVPYTDGDLDEKK